MNIHKRKFISIILFIIISVTIVYGIVTQNARANTIVEYEAQIQTNNNQINVLEEIKSQLHITAELLRNNDYINNGLTDMLSQKWHECNDYQNSKNNENVELQTKIAELKKQQSKKRFVGNFKITHYCPCTTCNGSWGSKTALGTTMTPYRTIAVDPRVIPLGSRVEINGQIYIAEDTGGAIKGNRIDMCVSSHAEAYRRGVLHNVPVYIVK